MVHCPLTTAESRRHLKWQAYEIGTISTEVEGKVLPSVAQDTMDFHSSSPFLSLLHPLSLTFSVQMSGPMSELVTQSVEWNQELDDTILKVCG